MSVTVNTASAKITQLPVHAVPNAHIGQERVTCHLSRGFNPNNPDGVQMNAFEVIGQVDVSTAPGDSLQSWVFGFIQIAKIKQISFYYAGKNPSQGSIIIDAHNELRQLVINDTEIHYSPWTKATNRYSKTGHSVQCPTGDHPAVRAGYQLQNKNTNATNYLFHIVTSVEFWTVFSYQNGDPLGRSEIVFMRHFYWKVLYDVMLSWRGGKPLLSKNGSNWYSSSDINGVPGDPTVQGLLKGSNPFMNFNNSTREAVRKSVLGDGSPQSRRDLTTRYHNVPSDFWSD
jgi:hypothetical protein